MKRQCSNDSPGNGESLPRNHSRQASQQDQARAQTAGNTPGVNVAPRSIVHTSETIVQFHGCECGRRVPPKRAAARFSVYDGYDDEGKPYACVAIRMLHDWPCAIRFDLARAARWGTGKREVAQP